MIKLGIELQEGFSDDTVVVSINEKEVFRQMHITTQVTGWAASFAKEVGKRVVLVSVKIVSKGISGFTKLDVVSYPHLGISITNAEVNFIKSATPFDYL